MLDETSTIEATTEMRDLARIVKRALMMIIKYLELRYKV
jgi:hypothetical protein